MATSDELTAQLADRLAVNDVVLRYFQLVDAKDWDHMDEVFTEDTTARWTPTTLMEGRAGVVGAMRHMVGSDEILTYHHVAVDGAGRRRRHGRGRGQGPSDALRARSP